MKADQLKTSAEITWCPGCGNFAILNSVLKVFEELKTEIELKNFVLVSGIGCHGKIVDYINLNSFYSIHGRTLPTATGIKLANPNLKVVCFAGDGDAYGEGMEHLIFSAKRNIDITLLVHNNRVYGLTTGQYTPTSPKGFRGKSTPEGSVEKPINPLKLMLSAGATFIARAYSNKPKNLRMVIKEAIKHRGFSIVDILQPCYTFFNTYEFYNKYVYETTHDYKNLNSAKEKINEWDYNSEGSIPVGILYKKEEETFENLVIDKTKLKPSIEEILERHI